MLKGQSKAKLEKYNKKDEFIIMFIIKIIDDILDENIFDIFEYIFIKEENIHQRISNMFYFYLLAH